MQFPMIIGLRRSRLLDAFIVLSALGAIGAAYALPSSIWIQAAILCMTGVIATWAMRQLRPRISSIRLERNGELSLLRNAEKDYVAAEILPGATVHPWLTVVRLKSDGQPQQTLIVTVDSLKAADFRRLRVFLRWRTDFSASNDAA